MPLRPEQMTTKRTCVELRRFDRLSSLCDELLHHIMSFLMARQAVQTCVLSKRWRNLWRYLPCLDFNRVEFSSRHQFICFVNSFFDHRRISRIETFRLDWEYYNVEPEHTKTWIDYVLSPQPPSVFYCPDMVIAWCYFQTSINITSHILKKLIVEDHCTDTSFKIHLSVPSLLYLHVNVLRKILLKNMASLVQLICIFAILFLLVTYEVDTSFLRLFLMLHTSS